MPLRPPDTRLGEGGPAPPGTSKTDLVIAEKRAYGRSVGRSKGIRMEEQLGTSSTASRAKLAFGLGLGALAAFVLGLIFATENDENVWTGS